MSGAFDSAWSLLKMPFDSGRGLTAETLYQGRRSGESDTGYWTPHKDKAVAYSLFGARNDFGDLPWVDGRVHIPEVYRVDAPHENIPLPFDMAYVGLGDASGAVNRRRVAFEDKERILPSFKPKKIPDSELADILYRLSREGRDPLKDDEFLQGGEIPKKRFQRIFGIEGSPSSLENWEGMYVDDDSRNAELMEALYTQYDDDPDGYIDWDSLATTMGYFKEGNLVTNLVRMLNALRRRDE